MKSKLTDSFRLLFGCSTKIQQSSVSDVFTVVNKAEIVDLENQFKPPEMTNLRYEDGDISSFQGQILTSAALILW